MIGSLTFQALVDRFGGYLVNGDFSFSSVSTDTRTIQSGDVFVALKGDRFDAHDFLSTALENGAQALVLSQPKENISCPQWIVADTTIALGNIARLAKEQFTGSLVAVTGSSGKTTVKGMLLSILQEASGQEEVLATKGNLNNHIGVPLTLFSLNPKHRFAVIEMGASGLGEIEYLTQLAKPNVALVNNVMAAHVEGFGSISNIANAKGEIYEGLLHDGIAVINVDDQYASQWLSQNSERKTMTFSTTKATGADVMAHNICSDEKHCASFELLLGREFGAKFGLKLANQSLDVNLNVIGKHNVANAVAAAACAYALSVDSEAIIRGLNKYSGDAGRLQLMPGFNHSVVIDDSYNANPGSVCAAIDVLASMSLNTVLVLGDMGELGDQSEQAHRDVGEYAANKNINHLLSLGNLTSLSAEAFGVNGVSYQAIELLIDQAKKIADEKTVFLIKGSRSSRMERVVQALIERGDNNNASLAC